MRIGVAGCFHESNTFAPSKTNIYDFSEDWVLGNDFINRYRNTNTGMGGVIKASNIGGWELVPIFYTQAVPSGIVTSNAMNTIFSNLMEELKRVAPSLDGLILILHGAMVSENIEDVEGEIMREIRKIMGHKPIALTLDSHANITEEMVKHSDILVGYDTYPHIDMKDRAVEACDLLCLTIQKNIQPLNYLKKPNILIAPSSMDTNQMPMKLIMDNVCEYEKDPVVLNITIAGGFPYADVNFMGFSIVVTTDNHKMKAKSIANKLCEMVREVQDKFRPEMELLDNPISFTHKSQASPIALIESSDNVGGGSPADATHVLRHFVEQKLGNYLMMVYDPESVEKAIDLGVDGDFSAYVGGKTDKKNNVAPLHGEPVFIQGKISLLSSGDFIHHGPHKTGLKSSMGKTAVIKLKNSVNSVVVLTKKRVSPRDINQYRSLGLEVTSFKVIVVKAAIAWKTALEDIVEYAIEIDTPGCCSSNLSYFKYNNIPNNLKIIT